MKYKEFKIKDKDNKEYNFYLYKIPGFEVYDILEDQISIYQPIIKYTTETGDFMMDVSKVNTTLKEYMRKLTTYIKIVIDKNGDKEPLELDDDNLNEYFPYEIREEVFDELLKYNFGDLKKNCLCYQAQKLVDMRKMSATRESIDTIIQ